MTFRELYDDHFTFVWRSLRRLGVAESDVSDAAQEVFVVVHRKLAEFEGRAKVTTWLFGICLRVASDRRRRDRTRPPANGAHEEGEMNVDGLEGIGDERIDIEAAVDLHRRRPILERILDGLPIEQRAVFTMFELDELTGDEIAEILDVPVGTVHSRLRLARDAFRAAVARIERAKARSHV